MQWIIDTILKILSLLWNRKKTKEAQDEANAAQGEADIATSSDDIPHTDTSGPANPDDVFDNKDWNKKMKGKKMKNKKMKGKKK